MKSARLTYRESVREINGIRVARKIARFMADSFGSKTCVKSDKKRFVIFGQGRTGSTLLVDILNRSTDVQCDGEILSSWQFWPESVITDRISKCTKNVYAFKLLSYQIDLVQAYSNPDKLLDWLQENDFKLIYLRRKDVLMHALSQMRARQAGFHLRAVKGGQPKQFRAKLKVREEDLIWWLVRLNNRDCYEQRLLQDREFLELEYEQNLEDSKEWARTLERVAGFVDITARAEPSTELTKINRHSLDEIVENSDEVRSWLLGTEYEAFIR